MNESSPFWLLVIYGYAPTQIIIDRKDMHQIGTCLSRRMQEGRSVVFPNLFQLREHLPIKLK